MPHNWVYRLNLGLQTISICARKNIKALKYKAFEFANSIYPEHTPASAASR
jgi:hypothetical protein